MSNIDPELQHLAVGIDKVEPYDANPRVGDVGAIATSLEANGQYRPIVVNKRDGRILAGNHTWKAARKLGWEDIAVTYVDVDEETARRIVLVDNRSNDVASYDEHALVDLLQAVVDEEGIEGLVGTGFMERDLDALLDGLDDDEFEADEGGGEGPDAAQVLQMGDVTLDPAPVDVAGGDVWEFDGKHLLYVCNLFSEHGEWARELREGDLFLPYPEPYVTILHVADEHRLVMVQPNLYLAGHLIHRHMLLRGEDSVVRR